MSKYFDMAKELSRRDGARVLQDCIPFAEETPTLDPREHEWIEKLVGRKLSNEEAQWELRAATVDAAVRYWAEGKVN
jgi:hypothetical protein